MAAIRIIDDHVQLASIGSKTHVQIEGHIQGIGNYTFPAADGGADQILKTNGAGVLSWLGTLTDNSIADALHRHSELVASDGSPDPALRVDATGQIGIGTVPQTLLHISGSTPTIRISAATGSPTVQWYDEADNDYFIMKMNRANNYLSVLSNSVESIMVWLKEGRVGIGTSYVDTSALLELFSTTGALLLTRMTTTQRDALTAVNGMLLYNSTLNKFQGYENGAWTSLI